MSRLHGCHASSRKVWEKLINQVSKLGWVFTFAGKKHRSVNVSSFDFKIDKIFNLKYWKSCHKYLNKTVIEGILPFKILKKTITYDIVHIYFG